MSSGSSPSPTDIWKTSRFDIPLHHPVVMGIVNVTPDSFSDGGKYTGLKQVLARADALVAEGADILDIGGESTRPGSRAVSEDEELRRVLPVVEGLARRGALISIDTRRASVARACLDAGARIVNDVSALRDDPDCAREAYESGLDETDPGTDRLWIKEAEERLAAAEHRVGDGIDGGHRQGHPAEHDPAGVVALEDVDHEGGRVVHHLEPRSGRHQRKHHALPVGRVLAAADLPQAMHVVLVHEAVEGFGLSGRDRAPIFSPSQPNDVHHHGVHRLVRKNKYQLGQWK